MSLSLFWTNEKCKVWDRMQHIRNLSRERMVELFTALFEIQQMAPCNGFSNPASEDLST